MAELYVHVQAASGEALLCVRAKSTASRQRRRTRRCYKSVPRHRCCCHKVPVSSAIDRTCGACGYCRCCCNHLPATHLLPLTLSPPLASALCFNRPSASSAAPSSPTAPPASRSPSWTPALTSIIQSSTFTPPASTATTRLRRRGRTTAPFHTARTSPASSAQSTTT